MFSILTASLVIDEAATNSTGLFTSLYANGVVNTLLKLPFSTSLILVGLCMREQYIWKMGPILKHTEIKSLTVDLMFDNLISIVCSLPDIELLKAFFQSPSLKTPGSSASKR